MRKIDHSRRQFMKTASYAAMAGVTASPLLHSMRALAAMSSHAQPRPRTTAPWSAFTCRAAMMATAP